MDKGMGSGKKKTVSGVLSIILLLLLLGSEKSVAGYVCVYNEAGFSIPVNAVWYSEGLWFGRVRSCVSSPLLKTGERTIFHCDEPAAEIYLGLRWEGHKMAWFQPVIRQGEWQKRCSEDNSMTILPTERQQPWRVLVGKPEPGMHIWQRPD